MIPLEQIVDLNKIGEPVNGPLGDVLALTNDMKVNNFTNGQQRTLLLAIDMQNDFMDNGALGVPGAHQDMENLLRFIHRNFGKITQIMASVDTHKPQQIFHPCWWENEEGKEPEPLTIITYEDIQNGKWIPRYGPEKSKTYVQKLEETSKKQLCIWPYHCIKGTFGVSLEGQFSKLSYLHSVARDYELKTVVKGEDPLSEMYGIIQPEYSERDLVRKDILEEIQTYDKVIIAGEAKSHCVLETLNQIVEHFNDHPKLLENIYVLSDCMSSIPGFEEDTENAYDHLQKEYGIQIISSLELKL